MSPGVPLGGAVRGAVAHSSLGCAQGVSLTTARECGQLVFLEGLRSAVDTFFRAEGEARPLQFLRSVRLQPAPGHSWWGPAQRCCCLPLGVWEVRVASGQTRPCCGGIPGSPCSDPGPGGGRLSPKLLSAGNTVTGSVSGKRPPRESRGGGVSGAAPSETGACYPPAALRPEPLAPGP